MTGIDWNAALTELIKILPNLCGILLIIVVGLAFRRQLGGLFARLSHFGAFGFEIEFRENAKAQLRRAILAYDGSVSENSMRQILDRAERLRDRLQGARILWVDDSPLANANIHRFLNDYGVNIDHARHTDEVLIALRWAASAYEVIVTDMNRDGDGRAGIKLLDGIREMNIEKPVPVFVAALDPTLPRPIGAREITDQVDVLLNHIFDVISRAGRWMVRDRGSVDEQQRKYIVLRFGK